MNQPGFPWLPVALAGVIGLAVGLLIGGPHDAATFDENAVRAVLDEQVAAWNRGDLGRFVDTYWDDDRLRFYSGGDIQKGRGEVLDRYRKRYQGKGKGKEMGTLTFPELDVTPLSPDVAQARGRWKVVTKEKTSEGLFTLVLRRFPEGWKITHDHTSVPEPPKKQ